MNALFIIAGICCVSAASGAQITRPIFWDTGLDGSGQLNTSVADRSEIHWQMHDEDDYDSDSNTSELVNATVFTHPGWYSVAHDPSVTGSWISKILGGEDSPGTHPYYLSIDLKNNFYTDFDLAVRAGADNTAVVKVNGQSQFQLAHVLPTQSPDVQYLELGDYLLTPTWAESKNTIQFDVFNDYGPSGMYADFTPPTLLPKPDIIWRDYIRGYNDVWYCSSSAYVDSGSLANETTMTWKIVGAGNFFGSDPYLDILWQDDATGQRRIWHTVAALEGQSVSHVNRPVSGTINGVIAGVGDFNVDAFGDILVRDGSAVGYYTLTYGSLTYTVSGSRTPIGTETDTNWQIAGVGQFSTPTESFKSKRDIVWRNSSTGANRIWLMSTSGTFTVQNLPSETDLSWRIGTLTKFDDDDVCDIVWSNSTTGAVRVWTMNANYTLKGTITSPGLPTVIPASWHGWQMVGPK